MNLDNCNFTNCHTQYGTITNYGSNVRMNVDNCNFVNNNASVEPGAINNCGILNVSNSMFVGNNATRWAGAIHTHFNAQTRISDSKFIKIMQDGMVEHYLLTVNLKYIIPLLMKIYVILLLVVEL